MTVLPRLAPAAALAALLALAGCARSTPPREVAAAEPVTVPAARVVRADLVRDTTLTGELVPYQEVEVMAKVAGYVQRLYVDVGDHVRQGQVLAVLEIPEMKDDITKTSAAIQRSQAELNRAIQEAARAEKAYEMARLTHSRLASVSKTRPGLVAQQEVDDALSREQMAQAQVAAARSALDVVREQIKVGEADRSRAETLLQYTRVVAPFDGVVTKRYASNGSMIQAGVASQSQAMPVVRLSQNHRLRLVLDVPEAAAGRVRTGSPVRGRIPSLGREFDGRVARTSDQISSSTRTLHTEVDVPNASGELIPGMYAEVTLELERRSGVLAVPLAAVETVPGGGRGVLLVNPRQEAERRWVETGLENPQLIEIRRGLSAGDTVILHGSRQAKPGQPVRPKVAEAERE